MAVSGLGVAIATGGALLLYAGIRDSSPLDALRSVASGRPEPVAAKTLPAPGASPSSFGTGGGGGAGFPQLLQAVAPFRGDQYSQAKRWQPGYSDCSSFVGKGLKSMGITPPGASTTWDYLGWSALTKVGQDQVLPGDLVVSTSHMAICLGGGQAVGQQNPKSDVRTGTIKDIMTGSSSYGFYRYSPAGRQTASA